MLKLWPYIRRTRQSVRCVSAMSTYRPPSTPLVVILGSTGTGKSELAVDLALRFNGEIVNADAMQLYKGLPIITNKISLEEQRSIPHHLLGEIGLDKETWVVGVFKREASRTIQEIRNRGRLPIVVGGTNYYTSALLFKDSLVAKSDGDSSDRPLAQDNAVEHPILNEPTDIMWKKLNEVDPAMAERWHPKDRRKIRRSLEIFLTTGKRASDIYAEQQQRKATQAIAEDDSEPRQDPLLLWVHTEDSVLKDRLNKRVDKMVDHGLMEEISEMNVYLQSRLETGESVDLTRGIWQSIGFKEFQPYLQALDEGMDELDLLNLKSDCLERMKTATRRYAKYQMKWIHKKMTPLLKEQGLLDRLYVMDSTDVSEYATQVADKATSITECFLGGYHMPQPASMSVTAERLLNSATEAASSQKKPCQRHCEACNITLMTEGAWQNHIKGKAHRRVIRHSKRTALIPAENVQTSIMVVEPVEAAPPQ